MQEDNKNKDKKEHLIMIEDIIKRMASNSFLAKGWSISLISAILIFAKPENDINFIYVALLPILSFWFLDAYYLMLERKFRGLYKKVRIDYVDNIEKIGLFDMNTEDIKTESAFRIMFSKSVLPIHLIIFIIICTIIFLY